MIKHHSTASVSKKTSLGPLSRLFSACVLLEKTVSSKMLFPLKKLKAKDMDHLGDGRMGKRYRVFT